MIRLPRQTSNCSNLRVIKTARDEGAINKAARSGFFPLVKRVEMAEEIKVKYAILQDKETGEIEVIGDLRSVVCVDSDKEMVIDFTFYYPYHFQSPYAAYLVPKDIKIGEKVFIEDLIQDYIGASWNQGDTYRLESCEAIWNGNDFDILYDSVNRSDFVG